MDHESDIISMKKLTKDEALTFIQEGIKLSDLFGQNNPDALKFIGNLIDLSHGIKETEGIKKAIQLGEELLSSRTFSDIEQSTLCYFLGNAWNDIHALTRTDKESKWEWEKPEYEKQIIYYRLAINKNQLPVRLCQIYTNLGNLFLNIGRFSEAIQYWNSALSISDFAMASANKGYGLFQYSKELYDNGHRFLFLKEAHNYLSGGIRGEILYPDALKFFEELKKNIEKMLGRRLDKKVDLNSFFLGKTQNEVDYRKWCLANYLFLNPLNDLGPLSIAGRDIMGMPDITTDIKCDNPPYHFSFFNQLKQEFVSARFLFFEGSEGINAGLTHYSDKDVSITNTLDYSCFGINLEKIKTAFRISYSIFDKIAFFINEYFMLGIDKNKVSFKNVWYDYDKELKKSVLKLKFQKYENWPLRGLFWLSKDLFEDNVDFREALEPEARELNRIRNHLEHKYVKIHEYWSNDKDLMSDDTDPLCLSMGKNDFIEKSLKILKLARAAMIYLSLAINVEERKQPKDGFIVEMDLDTFYNNRKM